MQWTDLLFAHWPVPAEVIARHIPDGLVLETFEKSAWLGVVPFRMEAVRVRGLPSLPGTSVFPEANVRTYVLEPKTGHHGVYFFSLEADNLPAVLGARALYRLPYYWAHMQIEPELHAGVRWWNYLSHRRFGPRPARLEAKYRGLGLESRLPQSAPGTIEYFLTERYALFTGAKGGRLIRADVHHLPWPLERAEAEFRDLSLARAAAAVELPAVAPLLHYARLLKVFAWPPKVVS